MLRITESACSLCRWKCRGHTEDMPYKDLDCNWVGSWLHPTRNGSAGAGVPMNDGELLDSVELGQVQCPEQAHDTAHATGRVAEHRHALHRMPVPGAKSGPGQYS